MSGYIFAWSAGNGLPFPMDLHFMFNCLAVIMVPIILLSRLLPKRFDKPKIEQFELVEEENNKGKSESHQLEMLNTAVSDNRKTELEVMLTPRITEEDVILTPRAREAEDSRPLSPRNHEPKSPRHYSDVRIISLLSTFSSSRLFYFSHLDFYRRKHTAISAIPIESNLSLHSAASILPCSMIATRAAHEPTTEVGDKIRFHIEGLFSWKSYSSTR